MFEIGRVCIKIAGREAGSICVIVDKTDDNTYLIDGNVKRRKCSSKHLEPTKFTADIKKDAKTNTVKKVLADLGFEIIEKKPPKEKKLGEKPKKQRKQHKGKEIQKLKKGSKPKKKKVPKTKPKKIEKKAKKTEKPKKKETKKVAKKPVKKVTKKPAKKTAKKK